ncbi:MAG: XdhC family protein [Planctomycetales bacterium]|nr:XdhC family protein [Planctomycetales bacterium]
MREVMAQLGEALRAGRPAAYCRLVETKGSTPQKAGATMLVRGDGSQAGTLGGGCVEAEVKRRALAAIQDGQPLVSVFQLDSDYGWDDGLICGGRMKVLIQPFPAVAAADGAAEQHCLEQTLTYFRQLAEVAVSPRGGTEAVVYESDTLTCPSSVLLDANGDVVACLGVEQAPEPVLRHLRPLSERPRPYAVEGIAYLPWLPRCRLVIVGGGHVGQAVGELAAQLDFDVWALDDRVEFVSEERFPAAERRIHGPMDEVLADLEITPDTYCLIVTRGHAHDERALYHLAERGARYVGMIGSRRKIRMIFEDLLAEGISASALEQVYAPLGIHIGSQTVPEIAVSICAELVAHRNLGSVPGRPERVAAAE